MTKKKPTFPDKPICPVEYKRIVTSIGKLLEKIDEVLDKRNAEELERDKSLDS